VAIGGGDVLGFLVVAGGIAAIFGWFSDKSKSLKEDEFNRTLKQQLSDEKTRRDQDAADVVRQLQARTEHLANLRREFEGGYVRGRKWLAQFIGEADRVLDDSISSHLRTKSHPALKAAEEVAAAKAEKRQFKERSKFLEYQLKSYKEYFPFLEEFEEIILDEAISLSPDAANRDALESADPVLLFVQKADYEKLSPSVRNQIALDRYLTRHLSSAGIGRAYERYLGYVYEKNGWQVEYHGIVEGYQDLGRDLICKNSNATLIIQAKCWAAEKLIHEKHIFQLFGTTQLYMMDQQEGDIQANLPDDLFRKKVLPIFITTTSLSPVAKKAAHWLKIGVKECYEISKTYPMIKCNINQSSKEKIYHLPFDQQYDRTKIDPSLGESYATTVEEAEGKGFRRAFRHLAASHA
jgi:hypothetical protein